MLLPPHLTCPAPQDASFLIADEGIWLFLFSEARDEVGGVMVSAKPRNLPVLTVCVSQVES